MSLGIRYKDPAATLDFSIIWKAWLTAAETIAASTWAVSPDDDTLVILDDTLSITDTTIWISGGVLGHTYVLTNTITTTSAIPRIDERSFQIVIQNQ